MNENLSKACITAFLELSKDVSQLAQWAGLSLSEVTTQTITSAAEAESWLLQTAQEIKTKDCPKPLDVLLESVSLTGNVIRRPSTHVYDLKPLSAKALFPCQRKAVTKTDYRRMWFEWIDAIKRIPPASKDNFDRWLDHLMSAWQSVAWCLPSQTAGVSLFENGRVRIAKAVAKLACANEEKPYLFIQADFQGIQNFIFTEGSQTNHKSAKLLRGRSFYVSLITEIAGLRVLDELKLPSTNVLISAAGKVMILAANNAENLEALRRIRADIDQWFIDNTLATSGLSLVWKGCSEEDFRAEGNRFATFMEQVFELNEVAKLQKYNLSAKASCVLDVDYRSGVSLYDERLPASSRLSQDQILMGDQIAKAQYIAIYPQDQALKTKTACQLPIFGFRVAFVNRENLETASLLRLWDISMPQTEDEKLFKGCALRHINGYVSRFTYPDEAKDEHYKGCDEVDYQDESTIKTFSHLACEDRVKNNGSWEGVVAIAAVKGDVDNLGQIFRCGLTSKADGIGTSPDKMMELSWRFNAFFAIYLPTLCGLDFQNTYTVFAGGDDFFLIGPWHQTENLAVRMHAEFSRYVINPDLHFSVGIAMCKPSTPPRFFHDQAEADLTQAKKQSGKNAITVYGETVSWNQWDKLMKTEENLLNLRQHFDISTAYLYRLFDLIELAGKTNEPSASIWRSRLYYNTVRMLEKKSTTGYLLQNDFLPFIVNSIQTYGAKFRIPLSNLFYTIRKS